MNPFIEHVINKMFYSTQLYNTKHVNLKTFYIFMRRYKTEISVK